MYENQSSLKVLAVYFKYDFLFLFFKDKSVYLVSWLSFYFRIGIQHCLENILQC